MRSRPREARRPSADPDGRAMKRLAVIGQPVGHSRSPAMHSAAFEALGIDDDWSYGAIELSPEEFGRRVPDARARRLRRRQRHGSPQAGGARDRRRRVRGRARDRSREHAQLPRRPDPRRQHRRPRSDREPARAAERPARARPRRGRLGPGCRLGAAGRGRGGRDLEPHRRARRELALRFGARAVAAGDLETGAYDVVVNATSVGMEPATTSNRVDPSLKPLPIDADGLRASQVVVDLVYASGETELARAARGRGATVVDGLEVLVHQGAESFRIWTGLAPPLEAMRKAAKSN